MNTPQNANHTQNPVKLTIAFGLLGVLVIAPWGFSLLIGSWSGRFFARSAVMRRFDADIYGTIDPVLPLFSGKVMIYLYLCCWTLALGLGLFMIYRACLAHPMAGSSTAVKFMEFLGRVATLAAFASLGVWYGLDGNYIYPPEGIPLLMSSFDGALGPLLLYAFPVAQVASYAFAMAVMIYAAFSARSYIVFTGRSLAGIAVMLAVFACLGAAAHRLDLGGYLDRIPGISAEPEPRTLVILAEKPVALPLDESFNDCSVSDSFCRKIPSSSHNARAVRAYLKDMKYMTALRGAGFNLIAFNDLRELDPAGALMTFRDALEATGDVTQGLSAITRLVYSPATAPYRKALDELSDETRFVSRGRSALRLSKAYARFGELDKARYWFGRGMADLRRLERKDTEYFRVPDEPPFSQGTIRGRLAVDGTPVSGVRVGLVRGNVGENIARASQKKSGSVLPVTDLQGLTDGTATDVDGNFSFTGLAEEEYVLLLSVEDGRFGRLSVENPPGLIGVSAYCPKVDVGDIRLTTSGERQARTEIQGAPM